LSVSIRILTFSIATLVGAESIARSAEARYIHAPSADARYTHAPNSIFDG
jgi:hypothetical protein